MGNLIVLHGHVHSAAVNLGECARPAGLNKSSGRVVPRIVPTKQNVGDAGRASSGVNIFDA